MDDIKKVAFISYKTNSNLESYIIDNIEIRNIWITNHNDVNKLNNFDYCLITISGLTDLNKSLIDFLNRINTTNCKPLGFYIVNSRSLSSKELDNINTEINKLNKEYIIIKDEDSIKKTNKLAS